ncbi:MAG: hypothetical protein JWM97_556 [Phycisphaerales bacterium]|nr:hypothetical protein [Phycisphaerales bacterium]
MAATATLPDKTASKGWKNWRVVSASVLVVGIAIRFIIALWHRDKRTPAQIRAAEKQRQKEIRRSLRGLT